MKIRDHLPIHDQPTGKPRKSSDGGVFQSVFDSKLGELAGVDSPGFSPPENESVSIDAQAWQALRQSLALLDQAMRHLENGEGAPEQLLNDIDRLRADLHRCLLAGREASELHQTDIILATEAARIRTIDR